MSILGADPAVAVIFNYELNDEHYPALPGNLVEIELQRLGVAWRRNPLDWIPVVACNDSAIGGAPLSWISNERSYFFRVKS